MKRNRGLKNIAYFFCAKHAGLFSHVELLVMIWYKIQNDEWTITVHTKDRKTRKWKGFKLHKWLILMFILFLFPSLHRAHYDEVNYSKRCFSLSFFHSEQEKYDKNVVIITVRGSALWFIFLYGCSVYVTWDDNYIWHPNENDDVKKKKERWFYHMCRWWWVVITALQIYMRRFVYLTITKYFNLFKNFFLPFCNLISTCNGSLINKS